MGEMDPQQTADSRLRAAPIVPSLLGAIPSMQDRWAAYLAYWDGRSEGDYLDMAEFAQHLVEMLEADQIAEFPAFFEAVEDLYRADDEVIDEVLTVGWLEGIQKHRVQYQPIFETVQEMARTDCHRPLGTATPAMGHAGHINA